MKEIADTGLIVALLARNDPYHEWALTAFRRHSPFYTCDAVLAEAGSFFTNPVGLLRLVTRGDLILDRGFVLSVHPDAFARRIYALARRHPSLNAHHLRLHPLDGPHHLSKKNA